MCGIFGVYGEEGASERIYLGLHNLQHRGQESAGIVSLDGNRFHQKKGMGIVNDVFNEDDLQNILKGNIAIGHVRYSTEGESNGGNAQPFAGGEVAVAHNGEIANFIKLKKELGAKGSSFWTGSDTEIFTKLLDRSNKGSLEEKVIEAANIMRPSYSLVIMGEGKLIGVRDVSGVRPLEIGKTENGYALSSETVGFDIINAKPIRSVLPGEVVVFGSSVKSDEDFSSYKIENSENHPRLHCIFEQIYLSRPDSLFSKDASIGMVRREFGRQLYRESPVEADLVIEVPDSSFDAAIGFSEEGNIRYDRGFHRNHYIGRTFIEPIQLTRDTMVLKKQNNDPFVVRDKRVVIVDDSIVRGTNIKKLVDFARNKGGASEVHVRISSPPYMHSCYLGVDTKKESELIAHNRSIPEIEKFIGADSLAYLSKEGMLSNPYLKDKGHCTYCFDGLVQIERD